MSWHLTLHVRCPHCNHNGVAMYGYDDFKPEPKSDNLEMYDRVEQCRWCKKYLCIEGYLSPSLIVSAMEKADGA